MTSSQNILQNPLRTLKNTLKTHKKPLIKLSKNPSDEKNPKIILVL
jgi:hypothetical protein